MASFDIRKLDFALLAVFLELMRLRKTTAVAERLGYTQSTISHALARLRDVFDDPLFLRRPDGLEPTARALALEPAIRRLVDLAEEAIAPPRPFDPAQAEGLVRIAASDYACALVGPRLIARLRETAPGLTVSLRFAVRDRALDALAAGDADLALGFFWKDAGGIAVEPLVEETYAVVARAGHPALAQGRIARAAYVAAPHALVSYQGDTRGIVDETLAAEGEARRVVAALPFYLPALEVVRTSDALLTLPRRLAEAYAPALGLSIAEPPIAIRPFTLSLAWHARNEKSGVRAFLAEQIRGVLGDVTEPSPHRNMRDMRQH